MASPARRRLLSGLLLTLATPALPLRAHPTAAPPPAVLADVEIVDRTTGAVLPVYLFQGRRYVAGTPGHRYAIAVRNRSGARVLAVMAVDGINVVTGETAAWDQNGYVFSAGQRGEITGWRKSLERVAAFEFAALPESYAARTGRPADVGVIGVALFRERVVAPPPVLRSERRSLEDAAGAAAQSGAARSPAPSAAAPLGTAHGASERSVVGTTSFERRAPTPDEVIVFHYDRRETLVAMGVIPPAPPRDPRPFPGNAGFVPDPPAL